MRLERVYDLITNMILGSCILILIIISFCAYFAYKERSKINPDDKIQAITGLTAMIISFVSLIILVITLTQSYYPGEVNPIEPSGYAIIRGISTNPSDHIILPLAWENEGGRSALIRQLRLVLTNKEDNSTITFLMAGEYPDIADKYFNDRYIIKDSFIIEPHTVLSKVFVFHNDQWWNSSSDLFTHRFHSYENYSADLVYIRDSDKDFTIKENVFILSTYPWVDSIADRNNSSWWWDFTYAYEGYNRNCLRSSKGTKI